LFGVPTASHGRTPKKQQHNVKMLQNISKDVFVFNHNIVINLHCAGTFNMARQIKKADGVAGIGLWHKQRANFTSIPSLVTEKMAR